MKKSLLLFMVIIVLMFVGCGNKPADAGGAVVKAESLEDTDTLQVCMEETDYDTSQLETAVRKFQELYPDVQIDVRILPYGTYAEGAVKREAEVKKIKTEVMSGEGPDLFVLGVGRTYTSGDTENLFEDLEKNSRAGVFCDLAPLLEGNENIQMDDFYEFAVNAGKMNGSQVIFPLSFSVKAILTTEDNIKDSGFETDIAQKSMDDFHDMLEKCLSDKERAYVAFNYYHNLSYPIMDYDSGTVDLPDEKYYQWTKEGLKLDANYCGEEFMSADYANIIAKKLASGEVKMFGGVLSIDLTMIEAAQALAKTYDTEGIFMKYPNENGKATAEITSYAAINANSSNKKNAVRFLEILLSEDLQEKGIYPFYHDLPIRKGEAVLKSVLNERYKDKNYLSDNTIASITEILDQVEVAKIGLLYEIPIEGDQTYATVVEQYMDDQITFDEFKKKVTDGLEFYLNE